MWRSSGYSSEAGCGWLVLTICAMILGALIDVHVYQPVNCVTVTGIKAAPMLPSGRQNFTYYEKEVCDE
jgi:hypothetical protein